MTGAKFDIEKFDRTSDFGLWRIKMRALLIQHRCEAALEVLPEDMEAQAKTELNKKAHSAVILCLGLYVRGRTDRRDSRQSMGKSRSKSRGGRLKCYIFQSEDHLKRNCPKNNRKKSTCYVKKDEQSSSNGLTYDDSKNAMGAVYSWVTTGSVRSDVLVESLRGKRYFLSIVDDYSGRVWAYILIFKHEAFRKFREWKQLVENQTGRMVKKLRTNNAAMKEEMDSLRKNKTWKLVDHPAGQNLVRCKWLFKIKEGTEGVQNPRYKARLVASGFTQRANYELEQLNVKTAFLHGNLEESPRKWYRMFDEYMLNNGFKRSSYDSCKFDMKELEKAKKILGMEIVRDRSRKIMRVSQSGYVSKILNNFRIDNGKSVKMPLGGHFKLSLKDCPVKDCDVERMSKVPYANAVGSLMYLMVCTRPDIAYAVSVVSRYLANPGKNHWEAVKWILKYLRGTANMGLVYGTFRGNHVDVPGFVDSDYAKDPDKCRSITEAEYMALTEAVKKAIWLRGLLEELGVELNTVAVNCDNQGAIHLSRNHVFHERTKHINVRYHFIREVLEAKTVKVLKVGTEYNVADTLTKVVGIYLGEGGVYKQKLGQTSNYAAIDLDGSVITSIHALLGFWLDGFQLRFIKLEMNVHCMILKVDPLVTGFMVRLEHETSPRIPHEGYPSWPELAQLITHGCEWQNYRQKMRKEIRVHERINVAHGLVIRFGKCSK
nr:retrovirus-related Pol polyprotein from transposon TNT 1-94 [Tanacetum cinerariifolium]